MKTTEHLIKINLPGGVVSAGDLYEMLVIAEKAGSQHIRFGNRQQLYFTIGDQYLEDMELDMLSAEISYEVNADKYPNIISSYIADTIFNQENWLKEGVYKDIFDLFSCRPQLKINLVDSNQTFVPFFTGNLNFISSNISNYWYLYVRYPKTKTLYCWPTLIYSDDIPGISQLIENAIFAHRDLFYEQPDADSKLLHKMVTDAGDFVLQAFDQPLKIPEFHLPYYEGINRHGSKYWLGIYRRDELFAIDFLKDVCNLCMQTRVGQLYVSPWKSLLVKSIEVADRNLWGSLLDKYRINVRHASNELNWQVEDLCGQCLDVKKQLVREFEKADLRTYRLSFAIKRSPKSGLHGAIIIRQQGESLYDIIHTTDFNPNTKTFMFYRENIPMTELGTCLIALCNAFYEQECRSRSLPQSQITQAGEDFAAVLSPVYQCEDCLTMYDADYGDEINNVPAGTPFAELEVYNCPTCGAGKDAFIEMVRPQVGVLAPDRKDEPF